MSDADEDVTIAPSVPSAQTPDRRSEAIGSKRSLIGNVGSGGVQVAVVVRLVVWRRAGAEDRGRTAVWLLLLATVIMASTCTWLVREAVPLWRNPVGPAERT